ncbi:cytochrome P450 4C1-like isoform X1 [Daphnia pulicaria]|uniref:cytochrome P450 4C1-like isoform X1 n=1 Tax=Daphnia pulicaria TaxID=35523 RepID=UPI001EEC2237|nr:cytochrome P450 4C1-like isoform X1 [Daphnia pulicaria]
MNSFYSFCVAFFVIGLILVLAIIGWWIFIHTSPFHVTVNKIPGPKFYLPLIGNALDLSGGLDHILNTFQFKWTKQYGGIYRIFVGTHCFIPVSSPVLLETILSSHKIIDKGISYEQLHPWLGQGLLTSSGDLWRSRRKLLTPAFHFSILNNFVEVFNEQSRILCGIFGELCQSSPDGKGEIDVYPLITRCSLDIICDAVMGTKMNAQVEDSDYVKAVYRIGQVFVERFQKPWLKNPRIFSLSALGREHDQLLKTLHGFTENVIRKRQETFVKQTHLKIEAEEAEAGIRGKGKLPLLDLLLKVSDDGRVLSAHDIRQEIDTFMSAGHDTTSSLIGWFLYSMASNPECQETVFNELQDVFGESERDCTQEDIPNLKYFDCCIKETLRIYPSVPAFERNVQEDVKIGEYLIPAGTTLQCLTLAIHRNPEFFPDPLAYKPERFFPEEAIGRHPYAYIPFSAGPRNCIGQRFALLESKVVLSSLLRRYKFELSPYAKPPIPSYHVILKSLTGINLVVSQR